MQVKSPGGARLSVAGQGNLRHLRRSYTLDARIASISFEDDPSSFRESIVRFAEAFMNSSLWMASCLASLVPFVQLSGQFPIDWRPFCSLFFESLVVYTVDHIKDAKKEKDAAGRRTVANPTKMFVLKIMCWIGTIGFMASIASAPAERRIIVGSTFVTIYCCAYFTRR